MTASVLSATPVASPSEQWLTERYSLFVQTTHGSLERGDLSHVPWPLQPVDVDLQANTLPQAAGLPELGDHRFLIGAGEDAAVDPVQHGIGAR